MTRLQFHNKPHASKVSPCKFYPMIIFHGYLNKHFTTCHVSTLPKSISDKSVSKKELIYLQNRFVDVKISFCHTFSYSGLECCPLAIPELSEHKQGSDYWQLIHYISCMTIYPFTLTQKHSDGNKLHIYEPFFSAFVLVSIVICDNSQVCFCISWMFRFSITWPLNLAIVLRNPTKKTS